jgi:hypothetical protein
VLLACRHDLPADQLFGLQTAYEKQKAKKAKTKKDSEATSIFHLIGSLTGTPPRLDEVYVLLSACFIYFISFTS